MYKVSLGFEVWVRHEFRTYWFCTAQFYYWPECLDYKDYCHSKGFDCIIRTLQPKGTEYRSEFRMAPRNFNETFEKLKDLNGLTKM